MKMGAEKKHALRGEGRFVEALLVFLKQITSHARWVFAVLLLLYALSGIRTIRPQESALVRRLGQLQPQLHGPGLLIGLPSPFDEVLKFETGKDMSVVLEKWASSGKKIGDPDKPLPADDAEFKRRMKEGTAGTAVFSRFPSKEGATLDPVVHGYTLTSDVNIVQGRFTIRYRIEDPFRYVSAGQRIEALIEELGYRALTLQIVSRPIDGILTSERRDIAAAVAESVRTESAALGLGIRVTGCDIQELAPPTQVLASFEDVTNARQFAKTLYENSRQYQSSTLAKSEGEAAAIRHRANGYAAGVRGAAQGEAASFAAMLENYTRQPSLVAHRLLSETLGRVMESMNSRTLVPAGQTQPALILEPAPEYSR